MLLPYALLNQSRKVMLVIFTELRHLREFLDDEQSSLNPGFVIVVVVVAAISTLS